MRFFSQAGYQLFCKLLLLTAFFLCIEISFLIQGLHGYVDDFNFVSRQLEIPASIIPGILFFIAAELLVHLTALLLVWLAAMAVSSFLKLTENNCDRLGLILWFLGLATVLFSNQVYFPHSKFAYLLRFLISNQLAKPFLFFLYGFWILIFTITATMLFTILNKKKRRLVFLGGIFMLCYQGYQNYFHQSLDAASEKKPNIILIGVDSLRPDFLAYFGSALQTNFFNQFLKQATVFSNTFTPLARTFPSWVGILSGVYPKESGIRFNLAPQAPNPKITLLTTILKKAGYQTIYATDETRFSNIDQRFGFDELLTPPMGLNDFLLGTFNDFPLSNLIVNTFIGKVLFPYSYASRPAYITYEPDSFLNFLKPYLRKGRSRPLFLAVHFCLPHYPYLWASDQNYLDKSSVHHYEAAILRVDQQLADFMKMLEGFQILGHAVVVLLSDHGEALELSGDRITSPLNFVSGKEGQGKKPPRFYPPSADEEQLDQSAGHGTDVLGFTQYHSLLAFRLYGLGEQALKQIKEPSLLLDIKPTILDFLKISDKNSGQSLRALIVGKKSRLGQQSRNIFLESDFSPEAIRSVHPETRNLILEGVELFKIDPQTTHIYVQASMGKLILSSKQYALVNEDWVLALYPQEQGKMIPVLVQRSTGKWTTDLNLPFAQNSPLKRMLASLKSFYGAELKQLE